MQILKNIKQYEDNKHLYLEEHVVNVYCVHSRDNSRLLGWLICDSFAEIKKFSFGEVNGMIRIDIHFIDRLSSSSPQFNQFYGSFTSNSSAPARASISKSSADSSFGGIYLQPETLCGNRIGGLVMYKIVKWLKQFDGSTLVNKINYQPSPDIAHIVEAFYDKFHIPLKGETTIKNLVLNDSWGKNILDFNIEEVFDTVWFSEKKIEYYQKQNSCLNELNSIIDNELTTWKSIFFGGKNRKLPSETENFIKDEDYSHTLSKIKTIKDTSNLLIKYREIKIKENKLIEDNKKLKDRFYAKNKLNIKSFRLKYLLQKIFFNTYSFWTILLILITFSNKEYIINMKNIALSYIN